MALLLLPLVGWTGCGSDNPTGSEGQPASWSSSFRYAAIGASDAAGYGALPVTNGYVYKLADRMSTRRAGIQLLNLGDHGATVSSIFSKRTPQAVSFDPDVVTISAGANDLVKGRSVTEFADDLNTLLEELHSRTTALLFLADVIDLTQSPRFRTNPDPDVTPERIAAYNASIRNLAATTACTIVPLSEILLHDTLFAPDGFHPNNEGYLHITEQFWAKIAPYLEEDTKSNFVGRPESE